MLYDVSPLYRMTVGFDRMFDMLDQVNQFEPMTNWPPYNVEKHGDDQYRITMAVAGFSQDEVELTSRRTPSSSPARSTRTTARVRSCIAALRPAPSSRASTSPTS